MSAAGPMSPGCAGNLGLRKEQVMAPVLIAKGAEGRVSLDFGDPVAAASTGLAAGTTDLAVDPADTGFVPGQLALLLDGHLTEAVRVVAVGTNLITLAPPGMQYAHGGASVIRLVPKIGRAHV